MLIHTAEQGSTGVIYLNISVVSCILEGQEASEKTFDICSQYVHVH